MIQNTSVLDHFKRDMREIQRVLSRADFVADKTIRGLLKYLVPNPTTIAEELIEGRKKYYQSLETLFSKSYQFFTDSDAWPKAVESRRHKERYLEGLRNEEINQAYSIFDQLNFEDLLPFFFDFKLKGYEYVLLNREKCIPVEKIKVVGVPKPESVIKIRARKIKDEDEMKKEK